MLYSVFCSSWTSSPSSTEIEKRVILWSGARLFEKTKFELLIKRVNYFDVGLLMKKKLEGWTPPKLSVDKKLQFRIFIFGKTLRNSYNSRLQSRLIDLWKRHFEFSIFSIPRRQRVSPNVSTCSILNLDSSSDVWE